MTERLYYTDSYLVEFDATVVESTTTESGRTGVILDRTAFYPTSGGQPFDTGRLGTSLVLDVIDLEDGRILHVLDDGPVAGTVRGTVDWERRFEHMQQHTGQHVLSAAFERSAHARTVSFHLGSVSSTLDLAREVSADEIAAAELDANRIVWEDRPIAIRFIDGAEAARLPLRKEPARGGVLRLIEIEEFDLSACGGTHVARTGAIGSIVVVSSEKVRGGTRLEFLCGSRALRGYRSLRDAAARAGRQLSVLPSELPDAVERLQVENREQKRRLKELQERLAAFEAEALAARAEPAGRVRLAAAALNGWDLGSLKTIAAAVVARPGHVAVLLGGAPPFGIVAARSADVEVDCADVLRALTGAFGGKGGGRPDLAQGGGLHGPSDDILARAKDLVTASAA